MEEGGGGVPEAGAAQPVQLAARAAHFHAADPARIYGGTPKQRFAKNRRAIEIYRDLEETGRPATEEEREALAGYTGWGSFGQELFKGTWERPIYTDGWREENDWLRGHLGQEEWQAANDSIINAHYTDPPTVQAMWAMVERLGFTGGKVLEPAAGIGNFFALMPLDLKTRSELTAIELDSLSAGMLKHLYPQANVRQQGYQQSQTPDDFYDLVIGNWPFANVAPADRRYNKLSPSLHDYFFLKALDQVHPGGLVIGVTSRYSLDGKATAVRMALARKAELVAAIRLPSGAFEEYAGTKVVTDILILKKRAESLTTPENEPWVRTEDTELGPDRDKAPINRYYLDNPERVLGTLNWGRGTTYRGPGVIVDRPADLRERLAAVADTLPGGVYEPARRTGHIRYITNNTVERLRAVTVGDDGKLYQAQGEHLAELNDVQKWQVKNPRENARREDQLKRLVELRRAYGRLIDAERDGVDTVEALRADLRDQYEGFLAAHGPVRTSYGLALLDKVKDPFHASLAALERKTGEDRYEPMPILYRSVVRRATRLENPSVVEAYVLARNESLTIDMAGIAQAAGVSAEAAATELLTRGAVFRTPTGSYEPADVYLGGNVRRKLREAQAAAEAGIDMASNIAALKEVMPKDVPYFNIEAKLGAQWVEPRHYRAFVADVLLGNANAAEDVELEWRINRWVVRPPEGLADGPTAMRWRLVQDMEETGRDADGQPVTVVRDEEVLTLRKLLETAFNNTTIRLTYKDEDGNTVVREGVSTAANERATAIREAFEDWVWKEPERKVALERDYNEIMNAMADPRFDGSFLTFDGMTLERGDQPFQMRNHQANAIWRGLVQGAGLFAHEVGTGKTYTMGGIAVESRRFGLAQKPLILAHNANSKSVATEIQEMYPGAKVLYINNLDPAHIGEGLAQIRNDDWDAVVMPHSLLDRLTLREETLMALAAEEIAALEQAFWEAIEEAQEAGENVLSYGSGGPRTMAEFDLDNEEHIKKLRVTTAKELVKARMRIIENIRRQAQRSSRPDAIPFEDLGVDMLMVDEAHLFKKPPMATRMAMRGLNKSVSNRSIALKFLTDYIKRQRNGRGVHLFTGTPITNTLAEIFHMQRYVMQGDMARDGIDQWDSWFNTFASGVSDVEFTAAGDYQAVTKLAGFINVAELRRLMGPYMDVVFADDMPEFKPRETTSGKTITDELSDAERDELLNGRRENPVGRPYKKIVMDVAEMSPAQAEILNEQQRLYNEWRHADGRTRYDWLRQGDPHSPVMIDGVASRASMDARLEDPTLPDHPQSKVNRTLANLLKHYREEPEAAQVVFMDKGYSDTRTRQGQRVEGFNLTKDLEDKLVAAGVPRGEIAIVKGGTTPEQKAEIAEKVNDGRVRIVIGQTETLGTGVNMQRRLRAMHHVDAPWMPGELEQRNGRGWRQGNTWNTVLEYRYITERIDGKRWQVLAVKDRFIKAFLQADANTRVIEGDAVSDEDSSYAETLSEAVGDPRLLQRQKLKADLDKLRRKERTHAQGVVEAREQIARNQRKIGEYEQAAQREREDARLLEASIDAAAVAQKAAYRTALVDWVASLGVNLTPAERTALMDKGWGTQQADRDLAKRVQAAVTAAELAGNARPKEVTTKAVKARLLNDDITTWDEFEEKGKTLEQRLPLQEVANWTPIGELYDFTLEARHFNDWQGKHLYARIVSRADPEHQYTNFNSIKDFLRVANFLSLAERHERQVAEWRDDLPKLREIAASSFPRQKDLDRKTKRLAEIESDMALNPVPAPAWLRHGAPLDSGVYYQGRPVVVEGHQWADDGYFVFVADGEQSQRVPYREIQDANGQEIYEEHSFVPPTSRVGDVYLPGLWVVTPPAGELNEPSLPQYLDAPMIERAKANGYGLRKPKAEDWARDPERYLELKGMPKSTAGIGVEAEDLDAPDWRDAARQALREPMPPLSELLRDPGAGLKARATGADWRRRAATVAAGGPLFSKGQVRGPRIDRAEAVRRLGNALGTRAARVLLDSGIITLTNAGNRYHGVTWRDGTLFMNLDALTAGNFEGVLLHEGFHSAVRELLGETKYQELMGQLDKLLASPAGWVKEAKAAVPADTAAANLTEEVGAYAISQALAEAPLPNLLRRWAEGFMSALRAAIIRRLPAGRLKNWALANLKPMDLARLARAGLRAKARGGLRGAIAGGWQVEGARYMFVGPQANFAPWTNNLFDLNQAKERIAQGEDAELVRQETGWHEGRDGKWRFEISDKDARFTERGRAALDGKLGVGQGFMALDQALEHHALFAAYPALADYLVIFSDGNMGAVKGVIDTEAGVIRLDRKQPNVLSSLLHELQHGIQTIEGFALGSNLTLARQHPEYQRLMAEARKNQPAEPGGWGSVGTTTDDVGNNENQIALEVYRRSYGEQEARATEARMRMTAEQRRKTRPGMLDAENVIVTFNNKVAENAPIPANADPETFSPANPDLRFSLAPDNDAGGSPLGGGKALLDSVRQAMADQWTGKLGTSLGALTLRQLADVGSTWLPGIKLYDRLRTTMETRRNVMMEESGRLGDAVDSWARHRTHRAEARAVFELMNDATLQQVDPADYQVLKIPLQLGPGFDMQRTWEATEANVQELRRRVRAWKKSSNVRERELAGYYQVAARKLALAVKAEAKRRAAYPELLQRWEALSSGKQHLGADGKPFASEQEARAAMVARRWPKGTAVIVEAVEGGWALQELGGQEVYLRFRDLYKKRSEEMLEALIKRLDSLESLDDVDKRALAAKIRAEFEAPIDEQGNPRIGPYFPLQRFGRFYVFARRFGPEGAQTFRRKDGEPFESAESARAALYKREDLKGVNARPVELEDGSGWVLEDQGEPGFWLAESVGERRQLVAGLEAEGWQVVRQGLTAEAHRELAGVSESFVADAVDKLKKQGSKDEADALYQMYLQTLQQMSIRKKFIHRKGTKGYTNDQLRAYGWNMTRLAHQISKLEGMPGMEQVLRGMEEGLKAAVKETPGMDTTRQDALLEEMKKRHEYIANPDNAPWTNAVAALGFLFYLGVSPAAALVNLSQVPIVALPVLTARLRGWARAGGTTVAADGRARTTVESYGPGGAWGETSRALTTAFLDVARGFKPGVLKGFITGRPLPSEAANLSAEERAAFAEWDKTGARDRTQAHNLAGIGDADSWLNGPTFNRVMGAISSLFHLAEVANRDATLLAAYRLARSRGIGHEMAILQAEEATWEAHFDYSNANRARFMQGNVAKALLMFKNYAQHVLFFLGRNLYLWAMDQDPAVRQEARTKFAGMVGMTALFAGTAGLPIGGAFVVANLVQALFGDDDEPWDAEVEWRNMLREVFPRDVADIIDRGAVNKLTGMDFASRVSIADLIYRAPDRDLDGAGMFQHVVEQLMGPVGGIAARPFSAYDDLREGHWGRAAEALAPKFLKDLGQMGRFGYEGVLSRKGDAIMAPGELSSYELFGKGLGFTPDDLAVRYDSNRAIKLYEGRIDARRRELILAAALAIIERDPEGLRAARQKIAAYNRAVPKYPISEATIRRSVRARQQMRARAEDGIIVNPKLAYLRDEAGGFGRREEEIAEE